MVLMEPELEQKLLSYDKLGEWRSEIRRKGLTLVVTNGCFDILHVGHVLYLQKAKRLGDLLLVGLNSDESVRAIKGPNRPINKELDRAMVLAALAAVDKVCIFPEPTAKRFLELAKPDIYVKGGDYTIDTINQEERQLVEQLGGRIIIVQSGRIISTSRILSQLNAISDPHL